MKHIETQAGPLAEFALRVAQKWVQFTGPGFQLMKWIRIRGLLTRHARPLGGPD